MHLLTAALLSPLIACEKASPEDTQAVIDSDGDGTPEELDCDDEDPLVHPEATESCDEIDNDCDELVDEGVTHLYYTDMDLDGYGALPSVEACLVPDGMVTNDEDCDDSSSDIRPGAEESCDELDNDCDESVDEDGGSEAYFRDLDDDGYGDALTETYACSAPDGYIEYMGDCDDRDEDSYPGAPELCDERDNDCDEIVDEVQDLDLDGYTSCEDCDDYDDQRWPGNEEICDGLDNDCDEILPEDEQDSDGDGFMVCEGDPDDDDPTVIPADPYYVGGISSSWTGTSYYRGNRYYATQSGTLTSFEVYLNLLESDCEVDFYVHKLDSSWTPLWSSTTTVKSTGSTYVSSGPIDIGTEAGSSYALGAAWNCSATYYGDSSSSWVGVDVGIGTFEANVYDNSYSGYSSSFVFAYTGSTTLAYDQVVYMAL